MDVQSHENRHQNWAVRLEEVLNDFDALQCFQSWLGVDDDSAEHPLRLHFAIIAFREMSAKGDARSLQLAREIFSKFLRPRVGLCDFIDASIRERIGQRLKSQHTIGDDLFDECLNSLDTFLRKQHSLFVQSHEFLDFFNASCRRLGQHQQPSTSAGVVDDHSFHRPSLCSGGANWPPTPVRRSRRRDSNSGDIATATKAQFLTADSLLRSQWEREAIIPAGGAGLFKPVSKFPYMGQAHASKKDSAVSSSFSSEANRLGTVPGGGGSHSMRQLREGQRRTNQQKTHLFNAFPRPADVLRESSCALSNCHETAEGRRQFAEKLTQRLRHVELQLQHEDSVNRQIDRINSARQNDTNTSTRELIIAGGAPDPLLLLDATTAEDADDDVENYFRRRMMDSSSTNSAQQSPPLTFSARKTTQRKSRGSYSPTAVEDTTSSRHLPSSQQQQQVAPSSDHFGMSQSCYQPSLLERSFDRCMATPSQNAAMAQMATVNQNAQFGRHRPPTFPVVPSAFFQMPSSSAFSQRSHGTAAAPPAPLHLHHHNLGLTPSSSALSQSVHLAGPSAIPAPTLAKHPSSLNPMKQLTSAYCDNDGDTSGIGSMTTTHSGNSAPGGKDRQRAAMFRRARELSSSGGRGERSGQQLQGQGTLRGGRRDQQPSEGEAQPTNPAAPPLIRQQQQIASSSARVPKMPISFRDISGDGVLIVAHVPQRPLTFREFRHYLSISSKDRRQFFFKSACEDGSAAYQLLLVSDDAVFLPVFEGKVSAECRAPLSDSD